MSLYDFYSEIVKRFISFGIRTGDEMLECDYSDFLACEDADIVFSAPKGNLGAGGTDKKSKLFGVALRMPNPEFKAAAEKELRPSTMDIDGKPRYLYSPVVKFRMNINQRKDLTGPSTFGIGIL